MLVGIVAVVGVFSIERDNRDDTSRVRTRGASAPAAAWVKVAQPPLSPRARAIGVWTGKEELLVGGDTFLCPPNADCSGQPEDFKLADGAAFNPSTGAWRRIASAPVPIPAASSAVVGKDVYFLISNGGQGGTFLRYSVSGDSWSQLPPPESGGSSYRIVAAGEQVVAFASSDETGERPDRIFDPSANGWSDVPDDPLSPAFDRAMIWSGDRVYLFDHELVPSPGSARPSLTRVARLNVATGLWERLQDSEILNSAGPWFASGSVLVTPELGAADGGAVNNWGRSYPFGGIFDSSTSHWQPLPNPPGGSLSAGAIGSADALYLATGGPLFDLDSNKWIDLPPLVGTSPNTIRTVLSAGPDAFVFGGEEWSSGTSGGDLLGDAWIWRSGHDGP